MKKIYKTLGLLSLMVFSFYYTDKIAIIMQNKSPIMQSIKSVEDDYLVSATNATIEGDYIVPGISGRMVNETKSYVNMKSFGIFNEYYLIFDKVKPDISLNDNLDKIIKSGNKERNSVAFLIEDNSLIKNYLKENNIPASILITESTYETNNFFEQINNDKDKYNNVESLLNKNNQNTNICYYKNLSQEFCKKNKKYLVEETFYLNSQNIVNAKNSVESGAIILIKNSAKLEEFKLLVKEINFKGLDIVSLSNLIIEDK
jgi:hypothetical protein